VRVWPLAIAAGFALGLAPSAAFAQYQRGGSSLHAVHPPVHSTDVRFELLGGSLAPISAELTGRLVFLDRISLGEAGLRCTHEGYVWSELDDGGTCSETPRRVIYPASARILTCGSHVCAVQLRYAFGGDTALRDSTARVLRELIAEYGEGTWLLDETMPCPRVEGDEFGCVLDGIGIVQIHWRVADPSDGSNACEAPSALIALRAEGDRGTHDARLSVTYVTRDAVAAFSSTAL
jgi:hypothetical protein